jgi:hypothetical protein
MNTSTQGSDVTFTTVYLVSHPTTVCHKNIASIKRVLRISRAAEISVSFHPRCLTLFMLRLSAERHYFQFPRQHMFIFLTGWTIVSFSRTPTWLVHQQGCVSSFLTSGGISQGRAIHTRWRKRRIRSGQGVGDALRSNLFHETEIL